MRVGQELGNPPAPARALLSLSMLSSPGLISFLGGNRAICRAAPAGRGLTMGLGVDGERLVAAGCCGMLRDPVGCYGMLWDAAVPQSHGSLLPSILPTPCRVRPYRGTALCLPERGVPGAPSPWAACTSLVRSPPLLLPLPSEGRPPPAAAAAPRRPAASWPAPLLWTKWQ